MLYKWTCDSTTGHYAEITARQLRELADSRTIHPTDSVGLGQLIPAYKFKGLFQNTIFLEMNWGGNLYCSAVPVTVSLNNRFIGIGNLQSGFSFWDEVQPGQHIVGVKLPLKSKKQYAIDICQPGTYCCNLQFNSGFWGNFRDQCKVYNQLAHIFGEGDLLNRWEAERQAAECPHCSTEWAVNFLGEKILDERQQYKTIARPELQWMSNPDPPFYGAMAQVSVERIAQVVIIVSTVREYFQCDQWQKVEE